MFDFLKIKSKIISIEVFFRENEDPLYRYVAFSKKGTQIDFSFDNQESITWQEMPTNLLKKNTAIIFVFTGKGIISKRTLANSTLTQTQLLKTAFPNSDIEDFYYTIQEYPNDVIVSMVRKSLAKPIIDQFQNKGVFIIGLYVGPSVVQSVLPYISPQKSKIPCGNCELIICEKKLEEINYNHCGTELISISGEPINSAGLIALGGVFHHISYTYSHSENQDVEINLMASEHHYYLKNTHVAKFSLIAFFFLLLCNFLLFDKYNKSSRDLEAKVGSFSNLLVEYDSLKSDFSKKKNFLESAGLLGNSRISFFADRIASDLPQTMNFESVNIFPIIESDEKTEELLAEKGLVRINGLTPNPVLLNEWVTNLSAYKWVKKITVQNYNKNSDNSLSKFEVLIQINSQ